jgi:hypothetical protein
MSHKNRANQPKDQDRASTRRAADDDDEDMFAPKRSTIIQIPTQPVVALGSHIAVTRGMIKHHGIVSEIDESGCPQTVVHYTRDRAADAKAVIRQDPFARFVGSGKRSVSVVDHKTKTQFTGSIAAARALSRCGEDQYDLFHNNCEHFATWVVTGESTSEQVETVTTGVVALITGIVASTAAAVVAAWTREDSDSE